MRYRRAFTPGGSFFFTVVTEQRRPIFGDTAIVDLLRDALRSVKESRPFDMDAMVVLPDHLHCIWTLPNGDADFATRWRLVKTWFTKHCNSELRTRPDPSRSRRSEQAIWQHRYWEHLLRDERDFEGHVDYIHFNPVKHGYVARPRDWPHSSFHAFVAKGILPEDWGAASLLIPEGVGRE
ncbi:MAG: transposase [Pseudomonadota bacterium]|nr:transposase [Pseudomonadota bacterium]